ncbi:sulfatase-like hydrolase/transferase [Opitutia bacterium ISCC 51]|nr:sulfatase-like hydrolase/transferase [Opitutae bacterium ISCC 51]QXD29810.1 sulfatase-like hydrolase/transferase [Opitutae bacterium ISCC 52]
MFRLLCLLLTLFLIGCGSSAQNAADGLEKASKPAGKPNVILVMADDLGWGDVAYNGHPVIKTPHLDAMAANGLKMNRFYAGAPVCSPTRGSVLSGRHPSRYGIATANQGHLKDAEVSLAEVMKSQGYATGHFGKWHLGTMTKDYSGKKNRKPEENYSTPGTSGSDEWFATEYAVSTWDPYDPANAHGGVVDSRVLYYENGKNIVDGVAEGLVGCDSRIIMDKALPFIEKQVKADTPFFTVIWFHAPHTPVVAGPEYLAMYPNEEEGEQHYYGVVTALDDQMGRLRASLKEWGVADNTMVWFCSDNGPEGNPEAKGRNQGSAGPFRGRKRSLYEGGVRVAGILEWPAKVSAGRETDFPAVTSDYFPTVLDVLGFRIPEMDARPYDGVSLVPLIEDDIQERPRPIAFQGHGLASLSDNRFKLVHNPNEKRLRSDNGTAPMVEWELYDLLADPAESNNLADQHPEVVKKMKSQLIAWQISCEASNEELDY